MISVMDGTIASMMGAIGYPGSNMRFAAPGSPKPTLAPPSHSRKTKPILRFSADGLGPKNFCFVSYWSGEGNRGQTFSGGFSFWFVSACHRPPNVGGNQPVRPADEANASVEAHRKARSPGTSWRIMDLTGAGDPQRRIDASTGEPSNGANGPERHQGWHVLPRGESVRRLAE